MYSLILFYQPFLSLKFQSVLNIGTYRQMHEHNQHCPTCSSRSYKGGMQVSTCKMVHQTKLNHVAQKQKKTL